MGEIDLVEKNQEFKSGNVRLRYTAGNGSKFRGKTQVTESRKTLI